MLQISPKGIGKISMDIFDTVKIYSSEWTETASRKFTDAEISKISSATVVPSKFGKSVCFMIPSKNGKSFIPLEPTASAEIGEVLDMRDLTMVSLKYTGTNPTQKVQNILRIRVQHVNAEPTFENPFGL